MCEKLGEGWATCQGRSGLLRKNPPRSSFIVVSLNAREFAPEFEGLSGMKIFLKEVLDSFARIHKGPPVHRGVAQPGRAPRLGRGCRQFESGRPDHFISKKCVVLSVPLWNYVFQDLMEEVSPTVLKSAEPRHAAGTAIIQGGWSSRPPEFKTPGRAGPPRPADLSPAAWQMKNCRLMFVEF